MNTKASKTPEEKSQAVANFKLPPGNGAEAGFQLAEKRPEVIAQRKLQQMATTSPQVSKLKVLQDQASNSAQIKRTAQLQAMAAHKFTQRDQPSQKIANQTEMPASLKMRMENQSGTTLPDVNARGKLTSKDSSQNAEIIQPKYYKTEKTKNKKGIQGAVNVETKTTEVSLSGRLIGNEGELVRATGSVDTPEYKVSQNRKIAAKRIPEVDTGSDPSDALRVQNLSAQPKGIKLGHLLTYHHGLEAKRRGKQFVIAQNVSDARGPFYTPLGFKDYDSSKPWKSLDNEEKALTIVVHSGMIPDKELGPILDRVQEVRLEKAASDMIIDTPDLIANSKAFYERSWEEE